MKMKRLASALLCMSIALVTAIFFSGCDFFEEASISNPETINTAAIAESVPNETENISQSSELDQSNLTEAEPQTSASTLTESAPPETTTVKPQETAAYETTSPTPSVDKKGSYTSPEDVAAYIHTFGTLPSNFITKSEARDLGWDNSKGNLWDVAEGKSIGGDRFGNYEGLLPKAEGRKYTECDVNYEGGYRGSERIIFSNDGLIFYTNDHYQTFTQLY